ncbi:hypothetical protein [Actinocrispum wychmicini]|uniref:Uncharacterized protein n=1 Tax=Actinocrispum wychmicini TaxID=1213861 RepID=A0A4R2K1J3_9PSEU|nr:hypothetical protein [Actinocrispum wychmicini]TCO65577.1 hypothetical protein EV192_1011369 [Actinocrispum wychmicini]
MRIRSVLAGVLVGAGVLLLGAPAVLADQQPKAPSTEAPTVAKAPPKASPTPATTKPTTPPKPVAVIVKPKGAPETGGGGTQSER